jgi:tetratricopeptide (TPR) repeat protein
VAWRCRGLALRRDHVGLRLMRGRCLLRKEQPEAALAEFRSVLQQVPAHVVAANGAVTACLQARKYSEAVLHAKALAKLLPGHASAACLLGAAYMRYPGATPGAAEKALRRALALEPAHAEAAGALVSLLQARHDWGAAIAVLRERLAREPSDATHVRLAQLYTAAGDDDAAVDAYQAALGLNAHNNTAIKALDAMCARNEENIADAGAPRDDDGTPNYVPQGQLEVNMSPAVST